MEIGIWGDSITYGAGDKEGLGWVGRLRNELDPGDHNIEVYNRGVCGHTTEDVLKRFAVEATSIEPKKIIFALGANDSKIPPGQTTNKISLSQYEQNIAELINQARGFCNDIFVVGITCVDEPALHTRAKFSNQMIQQYNVVLKDVCDKEGVKFIDVFDLLKPEDFFDGLHPNSEGYEKMFKSISVFVQGK